MILKSLACLFIALFLFGSCKENNQNSKQIQDLYVPGVLTFAGDTIPVQDQDIRERLERELWINTYWQSNTAQWIKKSGKWFPLIDSILKANNIPEDFKYLVAIESGFENVSSNKGAVGFWQLMEPTAKEFGLIINEEIDQRLDPEKAGTAACLLLKRGKASLGTWTAVAASYNIGITGLKKVMDSQYSDNYYDLLINQETGRYLFRILAAKLILSQPEKYGFGTLQSYPQWIYKKQVLDSTILNLAYWCRINGFSYKCFRLVNPWIRSNSIHIADSIGQITISIPTNCKTYTSKPLPINSIFQKDSSFDSQKAVFQNLVNKKDMIAQKMAETPKNEEFHEVKSGENLSLIASKYQLSMEELFELNPGLKAKQNKITKGLKLRISEKE
jgi:LysM repeat protein